MQDFRSLALTRLFPLILPLMASPALAHDVPDAVRRRLENGNWADYLWTGAEHMLTGFDHLLFLLGVVFFLSRLGQIVVFVTAFTLGHALVLVSASLAGISANHYLIDAVIAFSVMYKGFENLGGFDSWLRCRAPNLLAMVFLFGLAHGFGLASQVQLITSPDQPGRIARILWFNLGVELGQIAALLVMLPVINAWRRTRVWPTLSRLVNGALVLVGFLLLLFQLHGYLHEQGHTVPTPETDGWHSHDGGPLHRH